VNAFTRANLALLQHATTAAAIKGSISVNGGLPPATITVTADVGGVRVRATPPSLPTGWTIIRMDALIVPLDPLHGATEHKTYSTTDANAPYDKTVSVPGGHDYVASVWFEYLTTVGRHAYGPSTNATVTIL